MSDRAGFSDKFLEMASARPISGPLFRKYVALFLVVVCVALISNGALELWFSFHEHRASLVRIQREQAEAAAAKISQFVKEIERQIGWTTELPWSTDTIEQRRFDALRLLHQVPAITELSQLDDNGREQLRVSRLAMDVIATNVDLSKDPKFTEAVENKVYYGPIYFRRESEPYMTLSMAGKRKESGVSVAEVNLKFIWDVVSQIKVGEHGQAFVVDTQGRLVAHPDISLVLRNIDLSNLAQVKAARQSNNGTASDQLQEAEDIRHRRVLTAFAHVVPLGWLVFVELPLEEAYAPLNASILRSSLLLLGGLMLASLAGIFLARKMVVPIQILRTGAARIGSGDLTQRISIRTGDELEGLAAQFNDMASKLQESYSDLERKVEVRTHELSQALEQQTATSEVLRVISSSPGNLEPIFEAMLKNATRLCDAKLGNLFLREGDAFRTVGMPGSLSVYTEWWKREPLIDVQKNNNMPLARMVETKATVHIPDLRLERGYIERNPRVVASVELAGVRTLLVVPILKDGELLGAIAIYRQEVRPFAERQVDLVRSFANQAVIAIENARLFEEVQARTNELARSVNELRALGEVSQAVNSTLDLDNVLKTIVAKAVELSATEAGAIYVRDNQGDEFRLSATYGMSSELIAAISDRHLREGDFRLGFQVNQQHPLQIPDLLNDKPSPVNEIILRAGYRALLIVPLMRPDHIVGVLVVRRKKPGSFPASTVSLLETFATQSVLAIENAKLFREIEDKSRQIEIASQHKSQFLANMSHELRTPLNAILGYTELILDDIYGEPTGKMRGVLQRINANGHHLLGLINEVLDLSKIEAGRLVLSLADYSMRDVVYGVFSAVEPLANEKSLRLKVDMPKDLPNGRGDEQRLTQVLMNLVGNAIKFTDFGEVTIRASAAEDSYIVAVSDTGPGISSSDSAKIFDEFQQADSSATKTKGGTGLGLSIARRIVEMHGGRIWVDSQLSVGSTFSFVVPIRVQHQKEPI
jgi:signal transduction histidine kinase